MIVLDTEVYRDYFLLCLLHLPSGRVKYYEKYEGKPLDEGFRKVLRENLSIGFNSRNYDIPIIVAAASGMDNQELKALSDEIILGDKPAWQLGYNHPPKWDHIDLIELAIGKSSLKIYGGRLGAPKLQDLPFDPDASISPEQREVLRKYCVNDLETTALLYNELKAQIDLRGSLSDQYGVDMRSKSDAQIAEAILRAEFEALTGDTLGKPKFNPHLRFKYKDPKIIEFRSEALQSLFQRILAHEFRLSDKGAVMMPSWLESETVEVGGIKYQMGIGGLHSCEKRQYVETTSGTVLSDWDVASFYPNIILQQRLSPPSMGDKFLDVYQGIVDRRIAAKRAGDKVTADVLKITVNGTFGKLGSRYSFLYAPQLLIQTTITGQLSLLMLIEMMSDAGIRCMSANTDGIVLLCDKAQEQVMEEIAWDWMLRTSYELERTDYIALASRDVNNYVAVKPNGSIKGKGIFAPASLAKNPDGQIVYDAVAARIARGVSISKTIRECRDIKKFVTIRRVQGGGEWQGEYLGKAVRFYYSTAVDPGATINYVKNGNKVPKSQGTKPLMTLPDSFPDDVNYEVYEASAKKLLWEVGYA